MGSKNLAIVLGVVVMVTIGIIKFVGAKMLSTIAIVVVAVWFTGTILGKLMGGK